MQKIILLLTKIKEGSRLHFLVKIMYVSRNMVLAKHASRPLKHKIISYNSVISVNEPRCVLITALIMLY
jgi:hypothetical protein